MSWIHETDMNRLFEAGARRGLHARGLRRFLAPSTFAKRIHGHAAPRRWHADGLPTPAAMVRFGAKMVF